VYDGQASSLDSWLYNNQDCISHFAAGNYGENDDLTSTITSPATAKNTVTVGATKSAVPNYVSQTIAPVFMMSVEIKRAGRDPQYVGVRLVKAGEWAPTLPVSTVIKRRGRRRGEHSRAAAMWLVFSRCC
jgi:hypothetical protein